VVLKVVVTAAVTEPTVCVMLSANKVQEAMTPAEKEKLYAAIGYQESGALAIYPKEVALLQFLLWGRMHDTVVR